MSDEYSMIRVADADRKPSAISGTPHVDLVEELGCEEMRPKVWYLSPDDEMGFHRQTDQEELYYLLEGPGQIKIGSQEEIHTISEGTALRIPPETPRQLRNDTDTESVWLVVGAPPTEDDSRPASED